MDINKKTNKFLILFLFILVLTIIMTHPFIFHLSNGAIRLVEDQLFTSWVLNWDVRAFLSNPARIFDANIFYPEKNTLAYSDNMFSLALLSFPVILLSNNPLFAHNLLLFFSFIFSFFSMYLMMKYFLKDECSAVISGICFAFNNYIFAHLNHLALLWTGFIPLVILQLDLYIKEKRNRNLLLLCVFYILQFFTSLYYAYYLTLVILLYLLCFKISNSKRFNFKVFKGLIICFAILSLILSPIVVQYLKVQTQDADRSIDFALEWGADLKDFITPNQDNRVYQFLYQEYGKYNRQPWEHYLFPCAGLIVLVLCGIFLKLSKQVIFDKLFFIILVLFTFVIVLGPLLKIFGNIIFIKLPFYYLYNFLPGFSGVRAPTHLAIFLFLGLSSLAGLGFYNISQKLKYKNILLVLFVIVICLENFSAPLKIINVPTNSVMPPVFSYLSKLNKNSVLIELPMEFYSIDKRWTYFSIFHQKRIVNGNSGQKPQWYEIMAKFVNSKIANPRCINFLRQWGVKYIVIHLSLFPTSQAQKLKFELLKNRDLKLVFRDIQYQDYVFQIKEENFKN